jgi:hypothetical protein
VKGVKQEGHGFSCALPISIGGYMKVEVLENDAGGFIEQVEACANGVVRTLNPRECILVRINNWFGPKWLPFSAPTTKPDEGIAAKNLSLPLFVPHRVVAQRNFLAPT